MVRIELQNLHVETAAIAEAELQRAADFVFGLACCWSTESDSPSRVVNAL